MSENVRNFIASNPKYLKIGTWVVISFLTLLIIFGIFRASVLDTIALEQSAKCGIEEHTHTDECYDGDILICKKTTHVHSINCYIILLNDNDINTLVTKIDRSAGRSLESIVDEVVTRAITYSEEEGNDISIEGSNSETGGPVSYSANNISALNLAISEDAQNTPLVLNENLTTADTLADEPQSGESITVLNNILDSEFEGSNADTDNYTANFYIRLDGNWVCIGNGTFTTVRSGRNYTRTMDTADIVSTVNTSLDSMGISFTADDFDLVYATSATASSFSTASMGTDETTFGSATNNTARRSIYVRLIEKDGSSSTPLDFYTVTFNYDNGITNYMYVLEGETVTLPSGYNWTNDNTGTSYYGGETITINSASSFTATMPDGKISVVYDVNFPTQSEMETNIGLSDIQMPEAPMVENSNTFTEVVDLENMTGTYFVKNVSDTSPVADAMVQSDGKVLERRIINFLGWRVNDTDTIIKSGQLSPAMLQNYSQGYSLRLTGVWNYDFQYTATFFVRYDSVAVDAGGNIVGGSADQYTGVVFQTTVAGDVKSTTSENEAAGYNLTDETADNSFTVDQRIRALYGYKESGIYLVDFPDDEYIFSQLRPYATEGYLMVDGEAVAADDLHSDAYAIRWYVFKSQSRSWHVDGKLVRKEGVINVSKTFVGNAQAINELKNNYYITATNETDSTEQRLEISPDSYYSYDSENDRYTWVIDKIKANEQWTFKEENYNLDGYAVYAEYILSDVTGTHRVDHIEGEFKVTGRTYAIDEGKNEAMNLELTNYYILEDSLAIKKEDAATNRALSGAGFTFSQGGNRLSFSNDGNRYKKDNYGNISELNTGDKGYLEFALDGISLDVDDLVIKETTVPEGYIPAQDVVISKDENGQIYVKSGEAEYKDGVIIIKNHAVSNSVTIKKEWMSGQADVTVQLLANGRLATTYFSDITATVTLNNDNGWQYTWSDIPSSVDGQPVEWQAREIQIGNEKIREDNTFLNYYAMYSPVEYSTDENGNALVTLEIINSLKDHVFINITKVDTQEGLPLAGAQFKLELLLNDGSQQIDTTFTPIILTSDMNGKLTFPDLPYGDFLLTETLSPEGHAGLSESIIVTINDNNTLSLNEDNFYVSIDTVNPLSLIVKNYPTTYLEETGGFTAELFYIISAVIMLFSVFAYIISKKKAKFNVNFKCFQKN